jgi:3-methyladenine DNA glycosylase/8-oxoguanine DNA glycosylase
MPIMPTQQLYLSATEPFWFEDVIFAHGWVRLLPYSWESATRTLHRSEQLASGALVHLALRCPDPSGLSPAILAEVAGAAPLTPAEQTALEIGLRRAFVLDEEFGGWWALCASEPGLATARERFQGRMLRSPSVFEDLIKTVCSINTTWSQTKGMVRNLVAHHGAGDPDCPPEARAFPPPQAVAALAANELQDRARVGYRAQTILGIAQAVTEGRLDLERLQDPRLPDEEIAAIMIALPGLGPYAVAHMMMLLGRYDHLPVDTWLRSTVRQSWFGGRAASDREIVAAFERFRPYRSLAFRFYDWAGALRREVWTDEGREVGAAEPGRADDKDAQRS